MSNKYKNKQANALGHSFRSQAERNHALWLEAEQQAGRIAGYLYEKSYPLICHGKLIGKHKPDFTVAYKTGRVEVHEVKGGRITMTEAWRLRKKMFEGNYPEIKYVVYLGGKRCE